MPTRSQKRRIMTGAKDYASYIHSLNPALDFWFESSGGPEINHGYLGASQNGTWVIAAGAYGQIGRIGKAVLFDGLDTRLTVPAGVYANYSAYTYAILINPSSSGESNVGTFWEHGTLQDSFGRFSGAGGSPISAGRTTGATTVTTTGTTLSVWSWLFFTLNMLGDKKIHIYKSTAGVLSEFLYSTHLAVSSLTDLSAIALTIGNRSGASRTFAGLYNRFILFPYALTLNQMALIDRFSNP